MVVFALCALGACALFQPGYRRPDAAPLTSVAIDLNRYLGGWREAARAPNSFERGCVGARAEYQRRPDGLLGVRNACLRADGRTSVVVGKARIVGEGQLKVSFFGPFWGDYWVLAHDGDYSWSIVGEPSGRYLWVLTRAPSVSPAERAGFEARLAALGYNTDALIWNER